MGMTIPEVSRRGFLTGLGKMALGGAGALLLKPKAADAAGWHGYSQAYRNSLILVRAYNDIGRVIPNKECKPWVQDVVASASGYVVAVPTNRDNCTWNYSQDVYGYDMSRDIRSVKSGEIVQMRLRNYPYLHTAIVSSVSPGAVGFIDCNYVAPYRVGYHEFVFAEFGYGKISCYSIYTIL